jgi:hypothetical protein
MATDEWMASIIDYGAPSAKLVLRVGMLLMIMRNIHLFVARFSYNLNQQV